MKSIGQLSKVLNPDRNRTLGAIRRMAITLTAKTLWQLVGFRMPDGSTETMSAEPFTGIGVSARPPTSGKPEAIVLMIGDANTPAIVAVRDEKTRQAIAGALKADETALYNSQAIVHVTDAGKVEVRSKLGVAAELATKADLVALKAAINGAVIVGSDGGASFKTTLLAALAAWPVGTTVLKGQ